MKQQFISEIFNKDPECGWGDHHSIWLWSIFRGMMQMYFDEPQNGSEFERYFRFHYKCLFGVDLEIKDECDSFRLSPGGFEISTSPTWWITRALPVLRERCELFVGDCTNHKYRIAVVVDDISKRDEDVIVCPARIDLKPGSGGVSAAIHKAAGPELAKACSEYHNDANGERCAVGYLKVTSAGNLKCRQVYHVVPPNCQRGVTETERGDLTNCYARIFSQVHKDKVSSIAIPSIGTGKMGFPVEEAAKIAAKLLIRTCTCDPETKVVVCCRSKKDAEIYKRAIKDCCEEK